MLVLCVCIKLLVVTENKNIRDFRETVKDVRFNNWSERSVTKPSVCGKPWYALLPETNETNKISQMKFLAFWGFHLKLWSFTIHPRVIQPWNVSPMGLWKRYWTLSFTGKDFWSSENELFLRSIILRCFGWCDQSSNHLATKSANTPQKLCYTKIARSQSFEKLFL